VKKKRFFWSILAGPSAFRFHRQRFSFAGAKIHIYQALDGRISLYYGDIGLQRTLASPR
jgi:hypothetical protein